MDMFASYLDAVVKKHRERIKSLVEAEAKNGELNFVDRVAARLVSNGVCNILWEGRIPVLSVLLAHDMEF